MGDRLDFRRLDVETLAGIGQADRPGFRAPVLSVGDLRRALEGLDPTLPVHIGYEGIAPEAIGVEVARRRTDGCDVAVVIGTDD